MVKEVTTLVEFKEDLEAAGDRLVVVYFTASWCGPCKQMSPAFEEQAGLPDNANVIFLKVDVDEAEEIATGCNIHCMPTLHFYKRGKMIADFFGANIPLLVEKIKQLK